IAEGGKALIPTAGSDARYLVQVGLWVARDGRLVERSWTFREVSQRVQPDPVVAALVTSYAKRLAQDLDVVVGRTAVALEAHSGKLTTEETNLGDFVADVMRERLQSEDRKSTRLNSSHVAISYAVFCLKKKKEKTQSNEHDVTERGDARRGA